MEKVQAPFKKLLEIIDFSFTSVLKENLNYKWGFILFTEPLDWCKKLKLKKYGCHKRKSHISDKYLNWIEGRRRQLLQLIWDFNKLFMKPLEEGFQGNEVALIH